MATHRRNHRHWTKCHGSQFWQTINQLSQRHHGRSGFVQFALTATQVATDYNARRLAGTESGFVAVYHFDEGQGTRAYDSVGGFHGTLTNMAATAWVNSQNDKDQSALSVQTLGVDPNWANGVGGKVWT